MHSNDRLGLGPPPAGAGVALYLAAARPSLALPAELHERLELYAQVYSETYEEPVDLKRLLPHMLERFLTSDRGFQRRLAKLSRQQNPTLPNEVRLAPDENSD